jgi:hexosaminidase
VVFALDRALPPGGYELVVTETPGGPRLTVNAAGLAGAYAAAQTLRQQAGPPAYRSAPLPGGRLTLPAGVIKDAPAYAWRGVLLDVARHFAPPREVRRFIELAAAHHLNVVQLHLTDDQGWRFPSRRYPELTRAGAWRSASARGYRNAEMEALPHGGFYTQDDLREIVAYAHSAGVTVVPEIDLPGHVEAAIAAYPWLGTRKGPHAVRTTWGISDDVLDPGPEQVAFFCDILDEVAEVFDSPFLHVGGDEVPTTLWRDNPAIVARAVALGLVGDDGRGDVSRLHGWFLAEVVEHVRGLGRRAVVWDEGLGPDLPRDAVVMAWRGLRQGAQALAAGYDVVLAPEHYVYFDHRASAGPDEPVPVGFVRTVEDVYGFDPGPVSAGRYETVAGGVSDLPRTGPGEGPDDARPSSADEPGARDDSRGARADGWTTDSAQPVPGRLLGVQAAVWTEYLETPRRVDYATYPRLAAFAEVAWGSAPPDRGPGSAGSAEFLARLARSHLPRLAAAGVEYRPLEGPRPWQMKPGLTPGIARDVAAETRAAGGVL